MLHVVSESLEEAAAITDFERRVIANGITWVGGSEYADGARMHLEAGKENCGTTR